MSKSKHPEDGCKRDSCDGVGVVRRNNKAEYLVVCNKCGLDGAPHISYLGAWRNWGVLQISTEF